MPDPHTESSLPEDLCPVVQTRRCLLPYEHKDDHQFVKGRTLIGESPLELSPGYVLIRRRAGWSITCAVCGGYNISWASNRFENLHEVLDLHRCGEMPL